jgi:predicted phage terminase large subunit-like protein
MEFASYAEALARPLMPPEEVRALIDAVATMTPEAAALVLKDLDELDEVQGLELARTSFLHFCARVYPGFKQGPHHRFMEPLLHNVVLGTELRLTVSMPPRFGKALALDTEIPTPDRGFVRMGDLKPGDKVFAGDGSITTVVGVSPVWKDRPVYRVTTNDGYSVVADEAHEWDVVKDRKRPRWSTVDTAYVHRKTALSGESRALRIPLQGAVQFSAAELPIHPYVLGVWLGDGRTNSAGLCTADDFIFDKVNALEPGEFTEYATVGKTRHWRPGPVGTRSNGVSLQARLRALELLGDKHIPDAYMCGSPEQRLQLLQGLIDTDGGVGKNGNVSFYNTNEQLARQVQELVQSLGTKASLCNGPAMLNGKQFGTCWKVHFFHEHAASLPRKAERCRAAARTPERYIRAEPAGTADTVCIEVAHPSHLFLCTRGYIPTHNSETIAYLFVAWYLGHHPDHQIIMVTHTSDLSSAFGRKVRNLIGTADYQLVFPHTVISRDKTAADDWTTTAGGKYLALGVGGSVAGYGAHLLICDDLVSEQAVLSNPDVAFETAWKYMQVGPLQRLMPGGAIVMIGCMTAETRVLMADGSEKALQHIEVGDRIATYDAGKITTSRVTNWIQHRSDFVYKIRTTSGRIVRANKRHPFLVDRDGARTWVRLRDLKVGDCLVEAVQPPDVGGLTKPRGCAAPATSASCAPMAKLERSAIPGTGANGRASAAPLRGAATLSRQKGSVTAVTARLRGALERTASRLRRSVQAISSTATAFLRELTTPCLPRKAVAAPFASSLQPAKTQGLDKSRSCMSITATEPTWFAGSCATIATWLSATPKQSPCCSPLPSTYVATTAAIVEIVEDGFEPVFDMEVERTENFIANGVVSHNTRWGKKDPIGRALSWAQENAESLPWNEVRFPAILPSGKSLWPEQWPVEQLLAKKAGMQPQYWAAQYVQEPHHEEGALLKRDWWQLWPKDKPPAVHYVMQSWDTAHETKTSNDFSACTTWGVWFNEITNRDEIILMDAIKGRWEFPQLKEKALAHYNDWEPDEIIIEKKAAGAPLIQEFRQGGIPVTEVTPSRGKAGMSNDKRARTNAVAPSFADKLVWAPDRRWASEVIEQSAQFPFDDHDDLHDTVVQALQRFRNGGFLRLSTDPRDDDEALTRRRRREYY